MRTIRDKVANRISNLGMMVVIGTLLAFVFHAFVEQRLFPWEIEHEPVRLIGNGKVPINGYITVEGLYQIMRDDCEGIFVRYLYVYRPDGSRGVHVIGRHMGSMPLESGPPVRIRNSIAIPERLVESGAVRVGMRLAYQAVARVRCGAKLVEFTVRYPRVEFEVAPPVDQEPVEVSELPWPREHMPQGLLAQHGLIQEP